MTPAVDDVAIEEAALSESGLFCVCRHETSAGVPQKVGVRQKCIIAITSALLVPVETS